MISGVRAIVLDFAEAGPYAVEEEPLRRRGLPLEVVPYEQLVAAPSPAEIVVNAGDWPLPPAVLDHLPACRCIVSYGIGVDYIDLDDATRRGIVVANTPHANVREVAEHTLALILACWRRLLEYDRGIRAGGFRPDPPFEHHRLAGRTLGFLAFGRTAQGVSRFGAALGLRQIAHDPYADRETLAAHGVEPVDLDALLERSDIVSVHLPATPATRGFLDAGKLARMRRGAVLVITSRGAIYDADALCAALRHGPIAAAGVDVFPTEPLPAGHPLTRLPNVILTPHMAGASEEADAAARANVAAVIEAMLDGRGPATAVNVRR